MPYAYNLEEAATPQVANIVNMVKLVCARPYKKN